VTLILLLVETVESKYGKEASGAFESDTTVTYGSGDSDVVTLDTRTGRMKQYKFNVGSHNVTGNLTWNANGSLGTLAITNQLTFLMTYTLM